MSLALRGCVAGAAALAFGAWASGVAAQIPIEGEAPSASRWEIGATASAMRVDDDFTLDTESHLAPAFGARIAWLPVPLVALGIEAWRGEVEAQPGNRPVWGAGAHMRATPWAGRDWALQPALHFGVEHIAVDDDEDRSLAFVAGAGLARLARRWSLDVAVRNHHLSVDEEPVDRPDPNGESVETGRDSTLWELRASLALVFGAGG
jgi:hypothetical protein